MKKIIILICLLWSSLVFAEQADDRATKYNLRWMSMPMMCGMPADIDRYIIDNKFTPVTVSFGKEDAKEDGRMVFAITYYINDKHQTLAVAETPNDPYKCMIFHTFDMIMNSKLMGLDT